MHRFTSSALSVQSRQLAFLLLGFLLFDNLVCSQETEELRIDARTVSVVKSPWQLIPLETDASFRGLHVYSKNEIYVGGSKGTIVCTDDGGQKWRVSVVPGAEELEFRDIQAIDDGIVVAMTSGTPARIYRSTNAGRSWKMVYENKDPKVFLDAVSFWDSKRGVVMGDPINNKLFLLRTNDGGKTWNTARRVPATNKGEAGFAASGTNILVRGKETLFVGLGSAKPGDKYPNSRMLITTDAMNSWKYAPVPIQRSESAGIFSICFINDKNGVAVGGDYKIADATTNNYAVTSDGGSTWTVPKKRQPPSGYRSCVATWLKGREVNLITVGPNGTDVSRDLGNQWKRCSNEGFHAVDFTADGQTGFASGADGRLAKWVGIAEVKPKSNRRR